MIALEVLRESVPALHELPERVLRRVASMAVPRRYAARAVLYRAGDPPAALFLLLSGRVRVTRDLRRTAQVLHAEGAGGVLGEIPLFGGGPYPATATALEPTRCAVLSAAHVELLLREEPAFARFALRRIAGRARVILRRLDELSAFTVTARVASHLLARARSASGPELTLGTSQGALAEELGTAREVLVRALRTLCDAGAIKRTGRSRFVVANAERLRSLAMPKRDVAREP
ncbi:MAG: Crp/Fnr family transcriptional regulator [Gemmatimonadaceae bacterium]